MFKSQKSGAAKKNDFKLLFVCVGDDCVELCRHICVMPWCTDRADSRPRSNHGSLFKNVSNANNRWIFWVTAQFYALRLHHKRVLSNKTKSLFWYFEESRTRIRRLMIGDFHHQLSIRCQVGMEFEMGRKCKCNAGRTKENQSKTMTRFSSKFLAWKRRQKTVLLNLAKTAYIWIFLYLMVSVKHSN